MNRRSFLRRAAGAMGCAVAAPCTALAGFDSVDDAILSGAAQRIEKHRKGGGTIVVLGRDRKPVPGAWVQIEQTRHDFLFGSNIFGFGHPQEPTELAQEYRRRFAELFNFATLGFYWGSYEPEPGKPRYDYTDAVADWCAARRITCKGHPLIWDAPTSSPAWLPEDEEAIRELSLGRVREIISRYQGRIDIWDVVNEPAHLGRVKSRIGQYATPLGAVRYVAQYLEAAREANPSATLLVNDYRADDSFLRILEGLRSDKKFLYDATGIQSHMHIGVWPLYRLWEICETFGRLRLPIHFTEMTVLSGPRLAEDEWGATTAEGEAEQAEQVARIYTALFSHPAVEAVTWWDFSDLGAWRGAAAGFLRKDMSPKPAYQQLKKLIKDTWWTNAQGRTDALGEFRVGAFFGTHRVTVHLPNGQRSTREVHWKPGQRNRFVVLF